VQVQLTEDDDYLLTTSVTDNGPGFPDGSVGKILDFSNRTSTKAKYRTPTRGQQGNAMMTVVGIASVLGGRPVIIESQGFRHSLCATLVGERLEKTHNRTVVLEREGTTVSVTIDSRRLRWPVERSVRVARGFALGNPHATIELSTPASPAPCTYAATASDKWRK
jgi:DNA topoisomerase VI subunit B